MVRIPDTRLPKRAFDGKMQDIIQNGRPQKRWEDEEAKKPSRLAYGRKMPWNA